MLARVAAVFIMFFTVGMMSYAIYETINGRDPGLEAVHEAGLVTELNLSQTINDVTVTLDWAYADVFENRPSSAFVAIFPNLDPPARRMFLPADRGLSPHPKPTNKPSIYILTDAIRPYLL